MAGAGQEEYAPAGYEQVSLPGVLTVPASARYCVVQAESQDVRWRDDGTAPTTTVGMVLTAGNSLPYAGNLEGLKFTTVVTGGKLNVSYYS